MRPGLDDDRNGVLADSCTVAMPYLGCFGLLRPDVVTPTSQSLDDLRKDGCGKRYAEKDQGFVYEVGKAELGPNCCDVVSMKGQLWTYGQSYKRPPRRYVLQSVQPPHSLLLRWLQQHLQQPVSLLSSSLHPGGPGV
jgi:hypothetical protein